MAESPETIVDLTPPTERADGMTIRPLEDGSLEIDLEGEGEIERGEPVDAENLAENLTPQENAALAQRIIEMVDADIEARSGWIDKFKRGLEMAALIGDGDKPLIEGGATVVHPLISEAAVQFQARALAELFPASGPVKAMVVGEQTAEVQEQAQRIEQHMNWQMLEEDEGYFEDVDAMLLTLALSGSTFKKTYWDEESGIVTSRYVPAEDVIVPYKATSLRRARRVTHRFRLDQEQMSDLQDSGFYLSKDKVQLQRPSETSVSAIQEGSDASTESTDDEEDGDHEIYETAILRKMPFDTTAQHYLITVSKNDVRTLAVRRNSVKRNGREVRRERFVHYKYLPGMGFYGWGLFHFIGGLAKAATDTLRALLDAAAVATWQGGFATKEAKALGSEIRIKPGVWQLADITAEELNKAFYTPPYREPPTALVQLMDIIVNAGQRFGSTTEAMVGEGKENVPVGTTIARIEQASKVYSGIHKRLHAAAKIEFRLRADLNAEYLQEALEFSLNGSNFSITPEDYDGRVDVVPVSDPNIVSTPQRIALAQAQLELARMNPAHFDVLEAERRYLQALQAPEIDKVLIGPDQVPMLDPVSEGARAMTGEAIKAFPEQDHAAHLAVHMAQLQMTVGSPVEQIAAPALQAHIAQHMAQQYRVQMSMQLGVNLPDPSAIKPGEESPMPPEVQDAIGLAAAQMLAHQQAAQQQDGPPDPESALKMAQADKTAAEAEEVRQRVATTAAQAGATEQAAAQLIQPMAEQLQAAMEALQANAERDQKVEQALMNVMAELEDIRAGTAEKEQAVAAQEVQRRTDEQRKVETERAKAESEKRIEALTKQIDDLRRLIDDMKKEAKIRDEERAKAEKEHERKEAKEGGEKSDSAVAPQITIGPIVIEKAGGAKTFEIKKTPDGKYVGTSKEAPNGESA